MRIIVEFDCENAAFEDDFEIEVRTILRQAADKVIEQKERHASVCDAPERADVLLDSNGNTVGSVHLR